MIQVGMETGCVEQAMLKQRMAELVRSRVRFSNVRIKGYPLDEELWAAMQVRLEALGPVVLEEWHSSSYAVVRSWLGPDLEPNLVSVQLDQDGEVFVEAVLLDHAFAATLQAELAPLLGRAPVVGGTFMVLVKTPSGYALCNAGRAGVDLERGNYAGPVLQDYDHVVACLGSGTPCGRLVVLDGPPGTGKTFILRALAQQVRATFVLVAPSMVGDLSGPEVVSTLLANKDGPERERVPTVLVMEDADQALIRREDGNRQQLSDVLNLGDGLLGELCDIRVLATTNADRLKLDDAIRRPGRMCRHLGVGPLAAGQALAVYRRLVGRDPETWSNQDMTLAEVYRLARQDGWGPAPTPETPGQYL